MTTLAPTMTTTLGPMTTMAPRPGDPLADLPTIAGDVLTIMVLLTVTLVINNLVQRAHLPVPEAIVTVVIGIFAGGGVVLLTEDTTRNVLKFEDKAALQFMLMFIAPIIFAEGYGMKSRLFFDNITRVLAHAFLGTVISAIIVGVVVCYLAPLTGGPVDITLAECLAFGALISATDPVTTLVIFKQQGLVEKGLSHLYFTVLGESILNDAVGITLFDGFADFVKSGDPITPSGIASMAGKFAVTFIGSMAIGIVAGILTALVLKLARMGAADEEDDHAHFNLAEVLVMLGMSYIPFLIATALSDSLWLSGIVAVLFAGITSRHYAHYNLTEPTREAFLPVVELFAYLCETYTFLLVGMGIFTQSKDYSFSLIMWTIIACLVGRAAQVYPIAVACNCMSKARKFTVREMHISWFAGLRGAIAFMCALQFPIRADGVINRPYFITTTMVIVFVSMVLLGWPTAWFLKVLKVGEAPPADMPLATVHANSEPNCAPLNSNTEGSQDLRTARLGQALGSSRLGFLDKSLMHLVMTPRAVQERADAQGFAHRRHSSCPPPRVFPDSTAHTDSDPSNQPARVVSGQHFGSARGISGSVARSGTDLGSSFGRSGTGSRSGSYARAMMTNP